MGCHLLLQCTKAKSESEVAQSCPTLSDPIDCSLPGSSVHGIFPGKSTGLGCHCLYEYSAPQHLCPGGCLVSSCALPTLSPRLSSLNLSFILLSPLSRALCFPTTCAWPKLEANSGSFLCHRVLPQVLLPDDLVLAGLCKLQAVDSTDWLPCY